VTVTTLFIDESKERSYTMVAATVASSDAGELRQRLREFVLPGQRRLHFSRESNQRRRVILSALVDLRIRAHVFQSDESRETDGREACLAALVTHAQEESHRRLIIERDESIEKSDRRILYRELRARGLSDDVEYRLESPVHEPLLWIPDALAWSVVRGGDWRRRADPTITGITRVRAP
jgi:hypothetical protein